MVSPEDSRKPSPVQASSEVW